MTQYPEHEKLLRIKDQSQAIGEFVEWLDAEKDIFLCGVDRTKIWNLTDDYTPCRTSLTELLAEHFGIDLTVIEAEKRAILDEQRAMNLRGAA